MTRALAATILVAALAGHLPIVHAVSVQSWEAGSAEDFDRGTLRSTEVDEGGRVRLAPAFRTLWGPEDGIVWDLVSDNEGGAFIALSDPGRVVHVSKAGEASTWYETGEPGMATALAPDGEGGVWVGVSPAGQVVHVRAAGEAAPPLTTEAELVWAMQRHEDGSVWVATGSPGRVLRIVGDGEPEIVFESSGDPVRCLDVAPDGSVLAGTGLRGRVIRFDERRRPFVLLDTEEAEIVSVAAAEAGHVHVLAAKANGSAPPASPNARSPGLGPVTTVTVRASEQEEPGEPESGAAPTRRPPAARAARPGAVLYRLEADGGAWKVWEGPADVPYAVVADVDGRAVVATGDRGRLLRIGRDGAATRVLRFPSEAVSALVSAGEGRLLVGGSSDARLAEVGPDLEREGTFRTAVVDAGSVSEWGRVLWDADLPPGSRLDVRVRVGNTAEPDETWSEWSEVGGGDQRDGAVRARAARWLQAELELRASRHGLSPVVRGIEIVYQPRNRPPRLGKVTVSAPGEAWSRPPQQSGAGRGPVVTDDRVARRTVASFQGGRRGPTPIRRSYESGARTVSWESNEPDGDALVFTLEIRREGEAHWFPLTEELDDNFYSWDSRGLPDGRYRVRVTADDRTHNAPGKNLTDVHVTTPFQVDNSPPEISGIETSHENGAYEIRFEAVDPGGRIVAAEFAVGGGGWRVIDPEDGVADSEREAYRLAVPLDQIRDEAEAGLKLRITDLSGNVTGASRVLEP